jgi:fatty-acyl-CoA synthase
MNIGQLLTRPQLDLNKTALITEEKRLTYGELNTRANRLANALLDGGIKVGDRVAALMYNCSEYIELYFAASKIGAVLVPLNFRLVARELQFALNDSGSSVLVLGPEFAELVQTVRPELKSVRGCIMVSDSAPEGMASYEEVLSRYPEDEPYIEVDMGDNHLIIYTSGTTGMPKGAVYTHGITYWNSINQILDFGLLASDVVLATGPLYHVGALIDLTMPMFHLGGTVILLRSMGFDSEYVARLVEKEKATVTLFFPIMLYDILRFENLKDFDTTSLRFIFTGGEPVPLAALEGAMQAFPNAQVVQGYGLTEGSAIATFLPWEHAVSKMGSIGKACAHVEVKVVDDNGENVPTGEIGEIWTKSPAVSKGYWMRPEANRETFAGGWCHTGDLGRMDEDGFLYIAGRKKDMIISGAENIYPAEIENVLYKHAAISEVAVIGVPDDKWGEAVMAVVVLKQGQQLTGEEVIAYCKENLAGYKKPKYIEFTDALPRTASMKVQKHKLRTQYAEK